MDPIPMIKTKMLSAKNAMIIHNSDVLLTQHPKICFRTTINYKHSNSKRYDVNMEVAII